MATKEVNEQVKPIVIHDPDNNMDYTLEFNRDAIRFAEARRFDIDDVGRFPMTKVPELFFYAFRMHHMNISREKTDKIFTQVMQIKMGKVPEKIVCIVEPSVIVRSPHEFSRVVVKRGAVNTCCKKNKKNSIKKMLTIKNMTKVKSV